jgi:hypothetical protein
MKEWYGESLIPSPPSLQAECRIRNAAECGTRAREHMRLLLRTERSAAGSCVYASQSLSDKIRDLGGELLF